ncbi:MAG: phytoene/squalene synthase family protein, partial [Longimicrobiales bacterium]|nr:phytoene/squalene synthase family protein [Longimicrobiales bacterium]
APFSMTEADLMERLVSGERSGNGGPAPLREALRILDEEAGEILSDLGVRGSVHESGETRTDSRDPIGPTSLAHEVLGWVQSARDGVRAQENFSSPASRVEVRARDLGGEEAWPDLFRRHSRSFHFAARLFPPEVRRRITGVYVFCRFTDDLVDEADGRPERHGGSGRPQAMHRGRTDRHPTDPAGPDRSSIRNRLDAWRRLVRRAHGGAETGVPLLDQVVGPAGYRGIPLAYLDELLSGVEMDIDPGEYHDLEALRVYTYRVASVVGGWITEELGVRNPGILDRAFALGHAMQMTNILRDVGEDLRAGRLYLPLDRMAAHGILRSDLEAAARGRAPMPSGFPDLLEELMEYADREYRFARTGLHALPFQARAAVAVAARVYQGIHDEIRKRSYDSLTGRAYTTRVTKLRLGAQALLSLLLRVRHGGLP